jgi:hypothetical protein
MPGPTAPSHFLELHRGLRVILLFANPDLALLPQQHNFGLSVWVYFATKTLNQLGEYPGSRKAYFKYTIPISAGHPGPSVGSRRSVDTDAIYNTRASRSTEWKKSKDIPHV